MKIDGLNTINIVNKYKGNTSKVSSKKEVSQTKDSIEISNEGKVLNTYSTEPIQDNAKKIAELKEKIANGTYKVDPKLTAQSMINSIRE